MVLLGYPKLEFVENNYVSQLKRKLYVIHEGVRQQLDLRSQKVKVLYIVKSNGYFLKQDRELGCLILEELKGGFPSYKVIGKSFMRSSDG